MRLLIDEDVPKSVADTFEKRGHEVIQVRDCLPRGTADPVVAFTGDRLEAILVTWDHDFERIAGRIPQGNRAKFRKLGRISFRCNEVHGVRLLEKWIDMIEYHYAAARKGSDVRMIVQIQENAVKFL